MLSASSHAYAPPLIGEIVWNPGSLFFKRGFDLIISGTLLFLFSPLLLLLAILVSMDGGEVLFRQPRLGKEGRVFLCLKFRSMVLDSDAVLAKHFKAHPHLRLIWQTHRKLRGKDPRVTRLGAYLRRWSLDELPQLINVFKGEMSLIGPRPILLDEREIYGPSLTLYAQVRPGLTGLWQVRGRNEVSYRSRVRFDQWYIRHGSFRLDLYILAQTVPAVLKHKGAY